MATVPSITKSLNMLSVSSENSQTVTMVNSQHINESRNLKGQSHELHPPSENQPAIIVHICEDPEGKTMPGGARPKIIQTRCPERTT